MHPRDVLDANLRIVYGGVQRARRDRIAALWRSIVVTHTKGKRPRVVVKPLLIHRVRVST
jgi:hypothetical protein